MPRKIDGILTRLDHITQDNLIDHLGVYPAAFYSSLCRNNAQINGVYIRKRALQHTYRRSGSSNYVHILHGWLSPVAMLKQRTGTLKSSTWSGSIASNQENPIQPLTNE